MWFLGNPSFPFTLSRNDALQQFCFDKHLGDFNWDNVDPISSTTNSSCRMYKFNDELFTHPNEIPTEIHASPEESFIPVAPAPLEPIAPASSKPKRSTQITSKPQWTVDYVMSNNIL